MSAKDTLPLLARHEGVWDGMYRYYDANGNKTDEHKSRLICRFPNVPDESEYEYHQTNHYTWEDGRTEMRDFPTQVRDGRIWFSGEIEGWAAEVPLDENKRSVMLHWVRKDLPDAYLYEMIQISDCGNYRSRVWQWVKNGRLFQRTLIDESKVSDNWREYE